MALTDEEPVPAGVNPGLNGAGNTLMLSLLGNPRGSYNADCQGVTNAKLRARIVTDDVGPFRATGFDLAVQSLKEVMTDIKAGQPAVHAALSSAGMLCARLVRGSSTAISNHSWGCAIDLKINGVLDDRGDDKVQHGLVLIAPIFNRHGWFWGATFPTEDGMHFEVSRQKMQKWSAEGKLLGAPAGGGGPAPARDEVLSVGDRSAEVKDLQLRLNKLGHNLTADGDFGPGTRAAVVAFQGANGLDPDGIAGRMTLDKLKALTA